MFKKILLVLVCLTASNVWSKSLDEIKSRYDNLTPDKKEMFKKTFEDDGWLELSKSNDSISYYNYHYVKVNNPNVATAWIKSVITDDIEKDGMTVGDYTMNSFQFDCRNETISLLATHSYNVKTRKLINSNTISVSNRSADTVIPESVGAIQLKRICFISHIKLN